jgi:uncharacterized protein (TIGR03382 family)
LAAGLAVSVDAHAASPPAGSWVTYGHDFQRTGRADGVGALLAPKVAWTLPMGALLGPTQAFAADADGDGRPEIVAISGGRVIATHADGSTLWTTPIMGPTTVLGAWDLDGNGTIEVVVDTTAGVVVLGGPGGNVVARITTDAPVAATFAPESAHGGVLILAASRGPLSGYDFRNGLSSTAPAWTTSAANDTANVVDDVDGDGLPDLVRPLDDGFEVDDPLTGATRYALPAMGPAAYVYSYALVNVDGRPGDEIVAVDTSYIYSPACGIYVLGVQGGALQTLWSATASPSLPLGADFRSVAGATTDLDGDGTIETVYTQWNDAAQQWSTVIADSMTGAVLASLPGLFLEAVGDVDGDGKSEIVVRAGVIGDQTPARSSLSVFEFASRQVGPVAKPWAFGNAHVMTRAQHSPLTTMPFPILDDFDPSIPGLEILVGTDPSGGAGGDSRLGLIRGTDGSSATVYDAPATVHPTVIASFDKGTSATSQKDVVVSQDDGTVHVLDRKLVGHGAFSAGTYANWLAGYASPTGQANVFAATANNHLRWIDGRQLHADGTPYVRFDEAGVVSTYTLASSSFPQDLVVSLNGNGASLVTFEQGPTQVTIVSHDTLGVEQWRTTLAAGTQVYSPGAYALDLTGDGNDDLVLCLLDIHTRESLAIFDGVSGTLVRSTALTSVQAESDIASTGALADINGDGTLDLAVPVHSLGSVVAVDLTQQPFALLWTAQQPANDPVWNGTVTYAPVGAPQTPALLRSNGNNAMGPYERVSLAGSIVAASDQGLPPDQGYDRNTAVLVATPSGSFDLVSAGSADVGLSRLRRIAGDTMATMWTVYAANGAIGPSAPAATYALHDPIVLDVDGNGVDDIVFGSDDGYLYAASSADGSLVFGLNLGSPVAHVIAANVDRDPALEIVAALANGSIVAIDDHYDALQEAPDAGAPDAGAPDAGATDGGGSEGDASYRGVPEAGPPDGGYVVVEAGYGNGAMGGGEGGPGMGCGCGAAGRVGSPAGALFVLLGLGLSVVVRRRK